MPEPAKTVVALSELLRPLLPLFATMLGAVLAWFAVHRVAHLTAKRQAYGRYIGAAEVYANDLIRWVDALQAGRSSVMVAPVKAEPVNEPLGDILLVAPEAIAELIHQSQQCLSDLSVAAHGVGTPWEEAREQWRAIRQRLINQLRVDTGARRLPDRFFEGK